MAGASKFGGTENGADCSKCGGTVAVLFKTRNGTSLASSAQNLEKCLRTALSSASINPLKSPTRECCFKR